MVSPKIGRQTKTGQSGTILACKKGEMHVVKNGRKNQGIIKNADDKVHNMRSLWYHRKAYSNL